MSRAWEIGCDLPRESVVALPPALIHNILLGHARSTKVACESPSSAAVGFDDPDLERWGSLILSARGFSEDIQSTLPLDGHRPIGAPGILRWVHLALDELQAIDSNSTSFIQDWCSVVVWVERKEDRVDVTELTSTSLPILPFATFVSKKMIRHIPPKHMLPAITFYGIQENLFHEALHQQLASFLIVRDTMVRDLADCPLVHIPWRRTEWPIDRVLHAAWVYRHLRDFRRARLQTFYDSDHFMEALYHSLQDAELSLAYLTSELERHRSVFSATGAAVVDLVSSRDPRVSATS